MGLNQSSENQAPSIQAPTMSRLAIPLLLNSLLGLITTLVDTAIISAHSKTAAAAVSLANQVLMVAYDLSVLFGVGGTVLIAQALGRSDALRARDTALIAILANTVLGVMIGLVLAACAPLLVYFINAPADVAPDTLHYIRIIAVAIPFNGFLMASIACLRGFAQARVIFMLGIFAFPSYLVLDYLLVLGAGPIPALGATGSALATLIVRVGSVAVLFFVLAKTIGLQWRLPQPVAQLPASLRRLLELSTPSVLDNVAYGFYQLVLVSFIAGQGVVAIVARLYTLAITAFLPVLIMAISQANEVLVSYNHGAGTADRVRATAWRSGAVAAALATLFAIIIHALSQPLVAIFSDDAQVQAMATQLLFLTIFIQPLSGLNTVLFHSLRALGDARAPVIFSQLVMWCIAAPLGYVFAVMMELGVAGLWYAMIVEETAKTLYMIWRWSHLPAVPVVETGVHSAAH